MKRTIVAILIAVVFLVGTAVRMTCVNAQTPIQKGLPGRPDVRPGIHIPQPDLVITSFRVTGPATVVNGSVELPVEVVVKNQGDGQAPIFKVGVEFTRPGAGPFAVSFRVPGEASIWYPSTNGPLAGGKSVSFAGSLTFTAGSRGRRVRIRATADSCSGDEFMADFCRVRENNEANNRSAVVSIALP